jgi:hypothetical protein
MLKRDGKNVVKTEEKIDRNAVKTVVMLGRKVMTMACVKEPKMHAKDGVQMLKQTVTTEEREAKTINAKDKLTVLDLFRVTTKVTTEIIVAATVIVVGTNK